MFIVKAIVILAIRISIITSRVVASLLVKLAGSEAIAALTVFTVTVVSELAAAIGGVSTSSHKNFC